MSANVLHCTYPRTTYLGNLPLYIDDKPISVVDKHKILGVFLKTDLKWLFHHSSIRCKISRMTGVVHCFGKLLDIASRKKIATAFILPHLRFCLSVWGNASTGAPTSMDHVLLRLIRVITNNKAAVFDSSSFKLSGMFHFNQFLFYLNVCRVFNFVLNDTLFYYTDCSLNTSSYNTRGSVYYKLISFKHSRTSEEYCFQYAAINNWNTLPKSITCVTNFYQFKCKVMDLCLTL